MAYIRPPTDTLQMPYSCIVDAYHIIGVLASATDPLGSRRRSLPRGLLIVDREILLLIQSTDLSVCYFLSIEEIALGSFLGAS